MARQRQTTAERLRVVLEPAGCSVTAAAPFPDPRLAELVRLLARRAAREFIEAEERAARDRLPD